MSKLIELSPDRFSQDVIEASRERPVVVDFWAEWCGPCKTLTPVLERIAEEFDGEVAFTKINVDQASELSLEYGISSIPAVKAFRDGELIDEFAGLLPEEELRAFVRGLFPSATEVLLREAKETSDMTVRESKFRAALAEDPSSLAAKLGLAEHLIEQGQRDEAAALLEGLAAFGDEGAEIERVTRLLALTEGSGDLDALREKVSAEPDSAQAHFEFGKALAAVERFEEALASLIQAAELDKALAKSSVRESMVDIFHVIGIRSELADDYRTRLSRLMY